MATRQRKNPDEKLKYLINISGGDDIVIQIPANWKVTFAQVNPDPNGNRGYSGAHCVRVWEGEKLRAVFANATGLRDLSIPLARKVKSETHNTEWKGDSMGNFESSSSRQIEQEVVFEPDDVVFE